MFSVSGWNLAASAPTTQIDTSKEKKKRGKKKKGTTGGNAIPVNKKRVLAAAAAAAEEEEKEKGPVDRTVVNEDNVQKLYEKVIEGKMGDERERRKKKKEKKKRTRSDADDGEGDEERPKKKTLKEKKREKKAIAAGADSASFNITTSASTTSAAAAALEVPIPALSLPDESTLTPLQRKMRAKLSSARFRHINETLYTTPSASSLALFAAQPDMYAEYHLGFRQQVTQWPENPVDVFIQALRTRAAIAFQKGHTKRHLALSTGPLPLPRDQETGVCTVADLGCGDAKIAGVFNHSPAKVKKKELVNVLSFDLQASTPDVTIADVANLPLKPESVDIAVFCLALMGTNFLAFVDEAHRVLRPRGELWVAEIKSRFNQPRSDTTIKVGSTKGSKKPDDDPPLDVDDLLEGDADRRRSEEVYKPFTSALTKRGFTLRGRVDAANRMFVRMEFVKLPPKTAQDEDDEEELDELEPGMVVGRNSRYTPKAKGGGGGGGGEKNRMQKKKALKFIDGKELEEKDLLKPCVYRIR